MKVEKKLTPLEEKWEEEKLADANKKLTLDDAYTDEGKVHHRRCQNVSLVQSLQDRPRAGEDRLVQHDSPPGTRSTI